MYAFQLPSGDGIELREMTGAEEELLTIQRLIRSGDAVNQVLANCILRTGEAREITTKYVLDMLSGDRLFTLVKLRQISLGDEVELELACPNASCRAKFRELINVNDLIVTPYGEERKFTFTLPASGAKLRFGYLDGHKEKRLAAMQEPSISAAMLMRIIDIDGNPPSKKALSEMSMRDRSALRAEMLRVDAGIDTTIECDCEQCGARIRTRLEAEPAFLFPGVRL